VVQYHPDVPLKELGPHNGRLDIVLYFCLAWKATQRWRQTLLYMLVHVWRKLDVQLAELDVLHRHRVLLLTVIVEGELDG
jgi:hypothetical protein